MQIKVRTPSRLHLTLIDLNGTIGRIDGGAGISLNEPFIEITGIESTEDSQVKGNVINPERFRYVSDVMSKFCGKNASINVKSDFKSHVGLGSGTQISLSVGEVYNRLFDLNLSAREIAKIAGRGGTSGIGVAAFEVGGFIVDGGHSVQEKNTFLPSSASRASPPPIVTRKEFPDWKIILMIPELKGFSGEREVSLFESSCPVPLEDVREISHIILMKLIPSVVEKNLDDFGEALWRIQHLGFKKEEVNQYGDFVWGVMEHIREFTPATGMSSTGPTIYAITDTDSKSLINDCSSYFEEKGLKCEFVVTEARNRGASIEALE